MKNNALLSQEQGGDQILKVTALLYLKEALVNQKYESCRELIDTAKSVGVEQGDICEVITGYLNTIDRPVGEKPSRLRS